MASRKSYNDMAEVFKREIDECTQLINDGCSQPFGSERIRIDVISRIAYATADMFASDNPRFDRTKFLEACGVI